ncbi:MBL fold metallo-hydrolase [Campylobacter sp. MIT 12-5580]|uniref:MBL fold metallo-hydrolase n=1 Tax=Campylobacter sp. MIT 12-5580 TaxID=2040651 RepID=UPI0010F9034A|nr:MBL fold metallo-hydrolase [Campylobacter sp. MIT 12-5580]TKX29649.1 MBL fold metallo-hydrolase [Campylobacter sp. MIT 12-5580]
MKELKDTQLRIKHSLHFINDKARNKDINEKIHSVKPANLAKIAYEFFLKPQKNPCIQAIKSDLRKHFDPKLSNEDKLVWFGHSSYMLYFQGKSVLVDPVLLGNAAPLPFAFRAFHGTNIYKADDFNELDYLIITHNHYDHLSKKTIKNFKHLIKKAIVPLGVGKYLKAWGISEENITQMDWGESLDLDENLRLHCLETKHFSGRNANDSARSLWASFVLEGKDKKIYIGGDSGYAPHFKRIGERFKSIDLALLENGQYSQNWPDIHMFPHETLQACKDLNAKALMPCHNSKFKLSFHSWDEPLEKIYTLHKALGYEFDLLTPQIGEILPLWQKTQTQTWWRELKS